jgi:hypothetical protein
VYGFVPDPNTRWTANKNIPNPMFTDFRGTGQIVGTRFYGPRPVGTLMMEVFTFLNASKTEKTNSVYVFSGNAWHKSIHTGPYGADVYFQFADQAGTYADNQGSCNVRYEIDDGKGTSLRPILPTMRMNESSRWYIDANGAIRAEIDWHVGAGGEKKYFAQLVVALSDGTSITRNTTKTVAAGPLSGRKDTHTIDLDPIPAAMIPKIHTIHTTYGVDRGAKTALEFGEKIVVGLEAWDDLYVRAQKTQLAQDAAMLVKGDGARGYEGDVKMGA